MRVFENMTHLWSHLMGEIYNPSGGIIREKLEKFDNTYLAEDCSFDFDLATLGYTKTKWTAFLGSYVERDDLIKFFRQITTVAGEIILIMGKKTRHVRGPCVFALTIRINKQPTLTLHSRTAILPTRGCLELALASRIADKFKEATGKNLRFTWFCGTLSFWGIQFLPLLASEDKLERYLNGEFLFSPIMRKMMRDQASSKFEVFRRLVLRKDQLSDGLIPPLRVQDLPFIWRCDADSKKRIDLAGNIYRPGKYPDDYKLTPGMLPDLAKKRLKK